MRQFLITASLAIVAIPALADEGQPAEPRLDQLEKLVITAQKSEPADERLSELEIVTITAEKQQPADYVIDDRIAALLAEIDTEE